MTRGRMHCPAQTAAAILALAVIGGSARSAENGADGTDSTTQVVTIQNMQFEPAELIVKRGSRVVWINKDLFPHTATAQEFDSGSIQAGASWSHVASRPGEHAYLCSFHPTMKGRLIVR
ncbi:MAG TPA: cupredoxin family copper-binding protein [Steroidobacter sp.]|uniref:cupredoxin domain-containing protein n=1 Tax=Steroidobacter sp. TaxID=1978227 RepID=UPI002ED82CCD